jgi:phospholipase C
MGTLAKIIALSVLAAGCSIPLEALAGNTPKTPIHHLTIIVGENHSFDNLFATYQPRNGQQVANLLSKGIVDLNGAPGPNASQARQWQALEKERYSITPTRTSPFTVLPQPNTTEYCQLCNRPTRSVRY